MAEQDKRQPWGNPEASAPVAVHGHFNAKQTRKQL